MNSRNKDWHPADIIAALRKKGNYTGGGIAQGRAKLINAGECAIAPLAKRGMVNCRIT